ncbi:ATPase [Polaribacter pacificus]|uniref:ATPase n=1 Tax=Polaribacter pacificus TaxID=1775173 RepID=A0A917M9Q1_9FLAO|nr:helicase HerA-like domain-containing protein [Polaribacter pacificus]GGG88147.1 ATPase [Polaribacter pacificus]
MSKLSFSEHIQSGYTFKKDFITLGTAMLEGEGITGAHVKIPLKTLNRHGLIAGATGTGKTKTLQLIVEQLSLKGIPSLMMDIKGDLSGLAMPGSLNDHITWRHNTIGLAYEPTAIPVELMTISNGDGVRLRATVSEFGPVLLSKILMLNDTQSGIVSLLFKYCDDHKLPLLDLEDLKKILQYLIGEGKEEIKKEYGSVSSASVNKILRNVIELEQQRADLFFGEKSFEIKDLLRKKEGRGVASIIRLNDIQDKPKLFSTFMLSLLSEVYHDLPEEGDADVPKLAIFIDEAHLIFDHASRVLLDQIETMVKLIRSKGVGLFFVTQNPTDVPEEILSQLGLKVQHALRAFTAKDRRNIRKTAENYPISEFYKTDVVLTSMGIGEALVTALDEKGRPTPLAHTLLRAPVSRMDVLTAKEIKTLVSNSDLVRVYNETINRESAYEMLSEKIEIAQREENQEKLREVQKKSKRTRTKEEDSTLESLSKNTMVRQLGRTILREVTRGLLGILGVKKR